MNVNLLIECVKKHDYLYDLSHREYSNVHLKTLAWDSIAEELNQTSDACRLKWKTIKDSYRKYKKQLQKAAQSGSMKKVCDYRWSPQMSFLDAYNVSRVIKTIPQTSLENANICGPHTSTSKVCNKPPLPGTPFSPIQLYLEKQPGVNLKTHQLPTQGSEDNTTDEPFGTTEDDNHDSIDYLFLSYANAFRKFPLKHQLAMKIELAKMFSKAEWECSNLESGDPFTFVKVQSVMSVETIDKIDSTTMSNCSSSCSYSEQKYCDENDFEECDEHIIP